MKKVKGSLAKLQICEHKDHSMVLTRKANQEFTPEEMGLYGVVIYRPFSEHKVFVLAPDTDAAISQAYCALEFGPDPDDLRKNASAERLPLIIRGWGNTKF